MADPLALYSSVMGKLWEDERIRGKAAARIDARIAGRRQGRSFTRVGSMSARNVAKAASGQSRAAVFKRIRAGGCKTQTSLGNQLDYINDKAVYTYSTMTNALTDEAVLSEDQKSDIIEAWAETWRGSTKLGFTSHICRRTVSPAVLGVCASAVTLSSTAMSASCSVLMMWRTGVSLGTGKVI